MMRARARALQALERQRLHLGAHRDRRRRQPHPPVPQEYHQEDNESECPELGFLLRWRREVEHDRPAGPVERLEQQLELAISLEDYEEAARIRDQIQLLRNTTIEERERI